MPDLSYLLSKWWKQMLSVVVLSLVAVGVILFLIPAQYLSVATALPASSYSADKASIFNNNIQILYPAMGTPDDLDVIMGTAQLDTVYIAVAEKFDLAAHYKVNEQGEAAKQKTARLLKKNTKVIKSDYSELKVKVWDRDKSLTPQLANAIMEKLNAIHQSLQNESNVTVLNNLKASREKITFETDSLTNSLQYDSANALLRSTIITTENIKARTMRRNIMLEQLVQYEKLISQYQLMVDSKTRVLIVVEKARVSSWPDKPKKLLLLTATFVLSLLFSLLLALLLEKRKAVQR
jgi:capsular polysaccharide biosynthesis protein